MGSDSSPVPTDDRGQRRPAGSTRTGCRNPLAVRDRLVSTLPAPGVTAAVPVACNRGRRFGGTVRACSGTAVPMACAQAHPRGCRDGGSGSGSTSRMISRTTGGGVAAAEQQVAEQVGQRVAFGPLEVAVRPDPGGVAQGEQDRGDRVRRGRGCRRAGPGARRPRTPRTCSDLAELRGVDHVDLQEEDVGRAGHGVHLALRRASFSSYSALSPACRPVGDQVQLRRREPGSR